MSDISDYSSPGAAMTAGLPLRDEGLARLGDVVAHGARAGGEGRPPLSSGAADAAADRTGRREEDGDLFAGMGWAALVSMPFWAALAALIWFLWA